MAYKKLAKPRCQWEKSTCNARPTHVVYTDAGKPVGAYCKKHASKCVQLIGEHERKLKRDAEEARKGWPTA